MLQNQNASEDRVSSDVLVGLNAIGEPLNLRTGEAVKRCIRDDGLPATKVGRSWVSRMTLINSWLDQRALKQAKT